MKLSQFVLFLSIFLTFLVLTSQLSREQKKALKHRVLAFKKHKVSKVSAKLGEKCCWHSQCTAGGGYCKHQHKAFCNEWFAATAGECVAQIEDKEDAAENSIQYIVSNAYWGNWDYYSCKAQTGTCGKCGNPRTNTAEACNHDVDCADGYYCGGDILNDDGKQCSGKCAKCPEKPDCKDCYRNPKDPNGEPVCGVYDTAAWLVDAVEAFNNCMFPPAAKEKCSATVENAMAYLIRQSSTFRVSIGGNNDCTFTKDLIDKKVTKDFDIQKDGANIIHVHAEAKAKVVAAISPRFDVILTQSSKTAFDCEFTLTDTGITITADSELKVTPGKDVTLEQSTSNRFVIDEQIQVLAKGVVSAGPFAAAYVITAQPVVLVNAKGRWNASLEASFDYLQELKIDKCRIHFDGSAFTVPECTFKPFTPTVNAKIAITAEIVGAVAFHIGAEITFVVNGLPFKIFPNIAYVVSAEINAVATVGTPETGSAITGALRHGLGVDVHVYMDPMENLYKIWKDLGSQAEAFINTRCDQIDSMFQQNVAGCIALSLGAKEISDFTKRKCRGLASTLQSVDSVAQQLLGKGEYSKWIVEPKMKLLAADKLIRGTIDVADAPEYKMLGEDQGDIKGLKMADKLRMYNKGRKQSKNTKHKVFVNHHLKNKRKH